MEDKSKKFEEYFSHLKQISFLGSAYKKYVTSPILLWCSSKFGTKVMEVGCGIGSGVLGTYPHRVNGLDINTEAVGYCQSLGHDVHLINEDGTFPTKDSEFDSCVLDNVIEHISDPKKTLDECYRITKKNGGLIIAVPGERGFQSDADHKVHYNAYDLENIDDRWQLISLFSTPFFIKNDLLSKTIRQYCLVATYRKVT